MPWIWPSSALSSSCESNSSDSAPYNLYSGQTYFSNASLGTNSAFAQGIHLGDGNGFLVSDGLSQHVAAPPANAAQTPHGLSPSSFKNPCALPSTQAGTDHPALFPQISDINPLMLHQSDSTYQTSNTIPRYSSIQNVPSVASTAFDHTSGNTPLEDIDSWSMGPYLNVEAIAPLKTRLIPTTGTMSFGSQANKKQILEPKNIAESNFELTSSQKAKNSSSNKMVTSNSSLSRTKLPDAPRQSKTWISGAKAHSTKSSSSDTKAFGKSGSKKSSHSPSYNCAKPHEEESSSKKRYNGSLNSSSFSNSEYLAVTSPMTNGILAQKAVTFSQKMEEKYDDEFGEYVNYDPNMLNHEDSSSYFSQPSSTQSDHTASASEANFQNFSVISGTDDAANIEDEVARKRKNDWLVKNRIAGMSYKEIKRMGNFREAESTLRGRFRTLSKRKEERVRRPEWTSNDVSFFYSNFISFKFF